MDVQTVNTATGQGSSPPPDVGVNIAEAVVETKPVKVADNEHQAKAEKTKEDHKEDIPKIIEGMNTVLAKSGNHIKFVKHPAAGRMMVQIVDDKTDQVIRTIPDKELLDLAAKIGELIGVIMDHHT